MHVLLQTLGTRGDVQPFVALGEALAARGHEVTVSTGAGFEAMIAAAGLHAAPFSVDFHALLQAPWVQEALSSLRGKLRAVREGGELTLQQFEEQWRIGHELKPDVIVYNAKAMLAPYVARSLGGIAVPAAMQPLFAPTSEFPFMMVPARGLGRFGNRLSHRAFNAVIRAATARYARKWSARSGIDLAPRLDVLAGHAPGGPVPRLQAYSRHLVPKPADWPASDLVTGYWFRDPEDAWTPPPDLAAFLQAGSPPVYVGFGSMATGRGRETAHAVVEGLRGAGRRGILATGWGGLKVGAQTFAGNDMHVIEAAPHPWLFPRCAAVVHHGGAGTTHEALRWGRPGVICPVFADQPFWARRVADLGASAPPLPMAKLTPDRLAAAVAIALAPETAARAAALGTAIRAEDGANSAAEAIITAARLPNRSKIEQS